MLIPTIVHAMLQDRRKRIETQRTARESLEQKAKQEYDSTKERLEKEIPIHKDIDLVNYCAMENINPTAIILEELELSANSPILNKPIETAFDYARSLGPEDYVKYAARVMAKNRGARAIIYAKGESKRGSEFGSSYRLTGKLVIGKK